MLLSSFLQNCDEDGEFSSSEGSTVDGLPPGEGGDSVDFEFEESMDPDGCFPDCKCSSSSSVFNQFYLLLYM